MDVESAAVATEKQKPVLKAFSRALGREAHVLTQNPDLLWQQLYNRLQWEGEDVKQVIAPELAQRSAPGASPWIRLDTRYRESEGLIRTFEGHASNVNACVFSPDGRFIVSASLDHTVRVWDTATGQLLRTLEGHTGNVDTCAISPDGRLIVSAGHRLLSGPNHNVQVSDELLDNMVRLWESATGRLLYTMEGHTSEVNACTFSPDGRLIVSASKDKTLRICDTTGKLLQILEGHASPVTDCAFTPDGRYLTSTDHSHLLVWDTVSGKPLRDFGRRRTGGSSIVDIGQHFAFSPDGHLIVAESSFPTLRVLDFTTGESLRILKGHEKGINACTFSPDGQFILAASMDKTLRIWDVSTGNLLQTLDGHTGEVNACAFSPDSHLIVSASHDNTLRLWENTALQPISTHKDFKDDVTTCLFSPDGHLFASAVYRKIRILDTSSNQLLHTLEGQFDFISNCAFSPDGRLLVSAGNIKPQIPGKEPRLVIIDVWGTHTGQSLHTLEGHTGTVRSCAFSPDKGFIITTSYDKTLRVWNTNTGQLIHTMMFNIIPEFGIFSPDNRFILSTDNLKLKLWDATTFQPVRILEGHGYGEGCAFSPDGCLVAAAGMNFAVTIWNIATGKPLRNLVGHKGFVSHCAFSPDGHLLFSVSNDKTARIWNLENSETLVILPLPGVLQSITLHPWAPQLKYVIEGGSYHGGALYDIQLVGIEYGPIVITASKVGHRIEVHCPVCQHDFMINIDLLGSEITCPQTGCNTRLKINLYMIKPKQEKENWLSKLLKR